MAPFFVLISASCVRVCPALRLEITIRIGTSRFLVTLRILGFKSHLEQFGRVEVIAENNGAIMLENSLSVNNWQFFCGSPTFIPCNFVMEERPLRFKIRPANGDFVSPLQVGTGLRRWFYRREGIFGK